jgi:hypothetical protein
MGHEGTANGYPPAMCRSIKTLRRSETATTTGEIEAAARQYIRKVSGYRTPSARNAASFDAAIEEVAAASRKLLEALAVAIEEGPDRWTPGTGRAHAAGPGHVHG